MKVEGITLVITDPCYIRNSDNATKYIDECRIYGDWSCMCYKCDKEEAKEKSKEWDEYYFNFFNTYNITGSKKLYNEYSAKKKEFIKANCYGEFCADSGQVAVFDYATLSETDKEWIKQHDWCACVIPDYTGEFHYAIEDEGNNCSAHIVGDGFYTTQSGF